MAPGVVPDVPGCPVIVIAMLGAASLPLLLLTWLIERITKEAKPVPGCGCGGGCRGR